MAGQIQGNILVPVFQRSHRVVFSKGCPRIIDQHINGTKEQGRFLMNFLNVSFAGDISLNEEHLGVL